MFFLESTSTSKAYARVALETNLGLTKPPFLLFLLPMIIISNLKHVIKYKDKQ
jgi:hypothetical protein